MSEFLGARISLISKSDIRYVGILHQINSTDSTVALENVKSFGTEGRPGTGVQVPPSEQVYEYIVFRGTDVKDLKIEEGPATKENKPPPEMPNDPAIVGARARPSGSSAAPPAPAAVQGPGLGPAGLPSGPPSQHGPPGPPGAPGGPGYGFFPPQMGWGRGGAPGPNAFGGMPYPPPPQWFPGQEFPHMAPGSWANYSFPPGPGAPPGILGQQQPFRPSHGNQNPGNTAQAPKPGPIGPTLDKKPATPGQATTGRAESRPAAQAPGQQQKQQQQPAPNRPPPPVESKPTAEEVKEAAASLSTAAAPGPAIKAIPTGPKSGTRPSQIMPAIPLPIALTNKVRAPVGQGPAPAPASNAAALRDATQAAKAAVAVAMQKLEGPVPKAEAMGPGLDNLTAKVDAMLLNATHPTTTNRGGAGRGSGRGRGGPPSALVTVPATDFDFAQAKATFEEKLEKANENGEDDAPKDTTGYDKKRSFFDNISSEAKDRLDQNTKPGGREWRGEEQRKNMETFGQSRIDGGRGYRGHRGRGRGRGGGGRGRGQGRGWYGHNVGTQATLQ